MLADATGRLAELLPADCTERDALLGLVRIGVKFSQRGGKQPGFLHRYLLDLARGIEGQITFDKLLVELAYQSRRRELIGESASPVERVDREFELLTYHHPKRGRRQVPFKTVRNLLTEAKKSLRR